MITINLNKPLLDIDGTTAAGENISKVFATMLKSSQTGDAMKHLCWAEDLYRLGEISVDQSDCDYLEKFVKDSQAWALVKGRILVAIRDQRTAQKTT